MTGQIVGDTEWNGLPMPRRLWAILAVTFGVALSVLDGTIANVALPTIAHELESRRPIRSGWSMPISWRSSFRC